MCGKTDGETTVFIVNPPILTSAHDCMPFQIRLLEQTYSCLNIYLIHRMLPEMNSPGLKTYCNINHTAMSAKINKQNNVAAILDSSGIEEYILQLRVLKDIVV